MTWIRWDTGTAQHEVVGALAERLRIKPAQALGHYAAACCGFGEYQQDGNASVITSTTLEQWALWSGTKGKFALAFRDICLERREGQRDPVGSVKGWWRQRSYLEKQRADAARRHQPGEKTPQKPDENPRGFRGGTPSGFARHDDDDEDGNGTTTTSSSSGGPVISKTDYAIQCTVACNRGLRENPAVGMRFNELVTGNQVAPGEWQDAGIPISLAERVVYERALAYKPAGSNRQPTNLKYFSKPVLEAWEIAQGHAVEKRNGKPTFTGYQEYVPK